VLVQIAPLAGTLTAGTYRLINYSGALGGSGSFVLAGHYDATIDTSNDGEVNLIVNDPTPPALTWTGDNLVIGGITRSRIGCGTRRPSPSRMATR